MENLTHVSPATHLGTFDRYPDAWPFGTILGAAVASGAENVLRVACQSRLALRVRREGHPIHSGRAADMRGSEDIEANLPPG